MKLYHNTDYDLMRPEWQVASDLYAGAHDRLVRPEYLWLHQIESEQFKSEKGILQARQVRASRAQRTRYFNIPEIILSLWTSIFFRSAPIIPESVDEIFGGDTDNVDGYGKSLFSFVKEDVFRNYLLYGRVYILADAPEGQPLTVAEETQLGITPRLRSLAPLSVTDWDVETIHSGRVGKLNMLRHEYRYYEPRSSEQAEPKESIRSDAIRLDGGVKVRTYEAQGTENVINYKDVDWKVMGETPLKLDEIPVAYLVDRPWLREVNEETLRYFNLRSNKDNIQYNQGFDKTFVTGIDGSDEKAIQALTEYTVSILPENGSAIKLDPVDVSAYERALDESFNTALRVGLNMLSNLAADSRETMSAEAASQQRENMYALVDSTLEDIENVVNEAIRHAARFKGIRDFDDKVEFNRSISEASIDQFVTLAQAFGDKLSKYPLASKEVIAKAASKLDLSEEAIEEINTTEVQDTSTSPEADRKRIVDEVINGPQ